jgi:hypothetical protein
MIKLKRLFSGKDIFQINSEVLKFENEDLDLSESQNQMFNTILKKYFILLCS